MSNEHESAGIRRRDPPKYVVYYVCVSRAYCCLQSWSMYFEHYLPNHREHLSNMCLIPSWTSYNIPSKVWDWMNYSFVKVDGGNVEVWNSSPILYNGCSYLSMLRLTHYHVSKWSPSKLSDIYAQVNAGVDYQGSAISVQVVLIPNSRCSAWAWLQLRCYLIVRRRLFWPRQSKIINHVICLSCLSD